MTRLRKISKWAWWWISIAVAVIVADVVASKPKHPKPRSLSEYLAHLFPRGWKRAVLIGIMAIVFIHVAAQPSVKPATVYYEEECP